MTNWEKFRDDIYDYVDGLLPLDEKKRIDKQLEDDEQARQFFDEVKALRTQLRGLSAVRTSGDFDTVLRTRIRMERSIGRRGWLFGGAVPLPAMLTAGAVVLLAAVLLFGPQSGPFSGESTVANSVLSGYPVSSGFGNGSSGATSVRYVPAEPISVSRGVAIDRISQAAPNYSKIDSTRERPADRPILPVEF